MRGEDYYQLYEFNKIGAHCILCHSIRLKIVCIKRDQQLREWDESITWVWQVWLGLMHIVFLHDRVYCESHYMDFQGYIVHMPKLFQYLVYIQIFKHHMITKTIRGSKICDLHRSDIHLVIGHQWSSPRWLQNLWRWILKFDLHRLKYYRSNGQNGSSSKIKWQSFFLP